MSRVRDESKRTAILQSAKKLFAKKGYAATVIADISDDTGLPVGSVYTYFKGKEEILMTVIDEGWRDFYIQLENKISTVENGKKKLEVLVDVFLNLLVTDSDFIAIIMSDGVSFAKLNEKLNPLSNLITKIIKDAIKLPGFLIPAKVIDSCISTLFLGIMDSVRLINHGDLNLSMNSYIWSLRFLIVNTLVASIK